MGRLDGKVAIITGAANGIGRTAARLFCKEGAHVVVSDLDAENGEALVAELAAAGGKALWVPCNVGDETAVGKLIERTVAQFGALQVLYNNAGSVRGDGKLTELATEDWDALADANAKGTYLVMKHAIPAMLAGGGGSIVNTASIGALIGGPALQAYSANKAAIIAMTRSVAVTYARQGIRANAICPGIIATQMVERLGDSFKKYGLEATPMGRCGEPEEIARVALFLASDESSFVTATTLVADGGLTAI